MRTREKKPWPPMRVMARIHDSRLESNLVSLRSMGGSATELKQQLTEAGFVPGDVVEIMWTRNPYELRKAD